MAIITLKEHFATKEAADARAESLLRSYHPCGYGTRVEVTPDGSPAEPFILRMSRLSSCD